MNTFRDFLKEEALIKAANNETTVQTDNAFGKFKLILKSRGFIEKKENAFGNLIKYSYTKKHESNDTARIISFDVFKSGNDKAILNMYDSEFKSLINIDDFIWDLSSSKTHQTNIDQIFDYLKKNIK